MAFLKSMCLDPSLVERVRQAATSICWSKCRMGLHYSVWLASATGVTSFLHHPSAQVKPRLFNLKGFTQLSPYVNTLKGLRDRAILAVLAGCWLRRNEIVTSLTFEQIQQREGR